MPGETKTTVQDDFDAPGYIIDLTGDGNEKQFGLGLDLEVGQRLQLRTQHDGVDRTDETTWSSNDESVADFPDRLGRIRGVSPGTAWIMARWRDRFRTLRVVVMPLTITGEWRGQLEGALIAGEALATLEQNGMDVTGEWSIPMPQPLVALGAPADVNLGGAVEGTVEGSTADLEFAFLEAFHDYLGPDCGLHAHVESFTEDDLEATWHTEDTCPSHIVDEGTLDMHKN